MHGTIDYHQFSLHLLRLILTPDQKFAMSNGLGVIVGSYAICPAHYKGMSEIASVATIIDLDEAETLEVLKLELWKIKS